MNVSLIDGVAPIIVSFIAVFTFTLTPLTMVQISILVSVVYLIGLTDGIIFERELGE